MCDRDHRRIGYDLVLNQAKGKTMENMIFFLFRSSFMQFYKKKFSFFHVSFVQLVLPLYICSRMSPINRITRYPRLFEGKIKTVYVSICILVSKYLKTNLNAKFLKKNPSSFEQNRIMALHYQVYTMKNNSCNYSINDYES